MPYRSPASKALKVKRDPNGGNWRYSFRGGGSGNQLITTGDAGPHTYSEAEAFYAAYVKCYGYEPDDEDYPPGVLEAYDNMDQADEEQPQSRKSNYPPPDMDPWNRY